MAKKLSIFTANRPADEEFLKDLLEGSITISGIRMHFSKYMKKTYALIFIPENEAEKAIVLTSSRIRANGMKYLSILAQYEIQRNSPALLSRSDRIQLIRLPSDEEMQEVIDKCTEKDKAVS
jgi:SpoVK/Ycf46/Vps4 family AAA+-type ATPase